MLNLNEQPSLPKFELKTEKGEIKSYDTLLISYLLRDLDAEKDPTEIQRVVNKVFEVEVDSWMAMVILKEFTEFAEKNLEEPLKKVFGLELYSATSTDSHPESSESSSPPSSSD